MESTLEISPNGTKIWRNARKQWHREDGPAYEANGNKEWCQNNLLHREDGPAVEWANGNQEYWLNGKRHRTDGPAIILSDGYVEYWINGVKHDTLPSHMISPNKPSIKEIIFQPIITKRYIELED